MTPHGQRQVDAAKADGRWDAAYAPIRSATEAHDSRTTCAPPSRRTRGRARRSGRSGAEPLRAGVSHQQHEDARRAREEDRGAGRDAGARRDDRAGAEEGLAGPDRDTIRTSMSGATVFIVAAVTAEVVLLTTFNRWYFRIGSPLFRWRVAGAAGARSQATADGLEAEFSESAAVNLLFRELGPTDIGFREAIFGGGFFKLHYPPMMHGLIRADPYMGSVTVTGRANLFICALLLWFVVGAWGDADWEMSAWGGCLRGSLLRDSVCPLRWSCQPGGEGRVGPQLGGLVSDARLRRGEMLLAARRILVATIRSAGIEHRSMRSASMRRLGGVGEAVAALETVTPPAAGVLKQLRTSDDFKALPRQRAVPGDRHTTDALLRAGVQGVRHLARRLAGQERRGRRAEPQSDHQTARWLRGARGAGEPRAAAAVSFDGFYTNTTP